MEERFPRILLIGLAVVTVLTMAIGAIGLWEDDIPETPTAEPGTVPDTEAIVKMMGYNETLQKAGVLRMGKIV